jgi:hypothetical protein
VILPISAFQVAKITGLTHHAKPLMQFCDLIPNPPFPEKFPKIQDCFLLTQKLCLPDGQQNNPLNLSSHEFVKHSSWGPCRRK